MVIEVRSLSKRLGKKLVIREVSFSVREREIFCVLGPNGAGKTTLVRLILNVLDPTQGEIKVMGVDVTTKAYEQTRLKIGCVLENLGLSYLLTAYENLEFFDRIFHPKASSQSRRRRIEELLTFAGLLQVKNEPAKDFSHGMLRRLALARALINDPELLVLDEPTLGLDPESRKLVREMLVGLRQKGTTIFLTSHDLEEVQKVSDRIAVLQEGKFLAIGTYEELSRSFGHPKVRIRVKKINDGWLEQLRTFASGELTINGNELIIDAADRGKILGFLVSNEAEVLEMQNVGQTLEDVYLTMVKSEPGRRNALRSLVSTSKEG